MNQYRCETCENVIKHRGEITGCKLFDESTTTNCSYCGGNVSLFKIVGCASHSSHQSERDKVLTKIITDFIIKNEIGSGETIYQCDHVVENALEFIESLCDVVGYFDYDTKELRQAGE
jgi:hypothetical protein